MKHLRDQFRHQAMQRGFTLMEVLIGIAIFAIGMLALASLQGALTRSTAEAKVRTTAINIAEQIIEGQRGFAEVISGGAFAFDDIVDITTPIVFDGTMTRDPDPVVGVKYEVTQDVTDWYYDLATDAFTETAPIGAISPDYKTVVVNVAWNDEDREFVIDEGRETTDKLGGGFVEVVVTISSISVVTALQVAEQDDNDIIAPDIVYTPGANPDIVSLDLGDSKFKESLTPEPKVYRDNLETRFDVITYSTGNPQGALFLRREEFVAVSCECTLRAADAGNQGKSPVLWAGDEYTEPESLTKAYGEAAGNVAQSSLCGTCCRDHHDGGGGALYDPSRPSGEYSGGDHNHYYRQGGGFILAGVGDDYLEACRFVRKDGFFRLTQDFRLEGLNTFAGDYLITTDQVADYSDYVIGEVYDTADSTSFVPTAITQGLTRVDRNYHQAGSPPTIETAPRTASGPLATGDLTLGYTYLPTTTNANFQQLRGRSIYVDYLSSDLRETITCIQGKSDAELIADPTICDRGEVELDKTGSFNILELLPFFEIQTTYLNDWQKETGFPHYFDLTNETVTTSDANGPTHSRGKVEDRALTGADMVHTIASRGVTGLTASDPINAIDYVLPTPGGWEPGSIEVITGVALPPPNGKVITITLSSEVPGLKASNVGFIATNDTCNFITSSGLFTCFIPDGTTATPTLTITNFDKPPKEVRLCSSHQYGDLPVNNHTSPGAPKVVDLTNAVSSPLLPYLLYLTEDACPADSGPI